MALGLGMLLFVGLALPMRLPWSAGVPAVWVADRDGHAVVGLDADLFVSSTVAARFPVWLAPRPGGFWAVTAEGGGPLGEHAVAAWDGQWRTLAVGLGPIVDVATGVDGAAWCVEFGLVGKPSRVLRVTEAGALEVAVHPDALAVCGEVGAGAGGALEARALVADGAGRVTRYGPGGAVLDVVELGGELVDVHAVGGRVFVLDATGGGRLCVLDGTLALVAEVALGLQVSELGVTPDGQHVWVADTSEPLARRYDAAGVLEVQTLLPLSDVSGVLGLANGGALLVAPGGALRVDAAGFVQPGQGGFSYATDVCLAQ